MDVEIEKCNCNSDFPVVLQHQLTENALVCANCNLDKELELFASLKKEIANWNQSYNRIYEEWLETENHIEELSNPLSNLNEKGLQVTTRLNTIIPAYYWLHIDEGKTFMKCPRC